MYDKHVIVYATHVHMDKYSLLFKKKKAFLLQLSIIFH